MPKLKFSPSKWMLTITAIFALIIIAGFSFRFYPIVPPVNAKNSCNNISAPVVNSWFVSHTATLNGAVNPANSVTFSPTNGNCSFYAWSEQMFLWLTSPSTGRYGKSGIVLNSPAFFDVSLADNSFIPHAAGRIPSFNLRAAQVGPHGLPITFEKGSGKMLDIEPTPVSDGGLPMVMNKMGQVTEVANIKMNAKKEAMLFDKAGKVITGPKAMVKLKLKGVDPRASVVHQIELNGQKLFINGLGRIVVVEEGQAGGGDVLISQNGSLVYYTISANQVYAYFRLKQPNPVSPTLQFPTTQAGLNSVLSYAVSKGVTIIDPQALAIEIKTSWVEASTLPDPQNYIKMRANVPVYNKANPAQWVATGNPQTIELAMVGMHIVGSVAGHPEMIWATFEHINNTPNATFNYTNSGNTTNIILQNTIGPWTFCASGATGFPIAFNTARQKVNGNNIEVVPPATSIGPSNTIRWKAWGNEATIPNTPLNSQVISANNNVRNAITPGDVRGNYIHIGSTWTTGAAPSPTNQKGTIELANTTMETYQQGTSNMSPSKNNCFGCHTTNFVQVSHVFNTITKIAP